MKEASSTKDQAARTLAPARIIQPEAEHFAALRLVMEAMGLAAWDEDLKTHVTTWSRAAYEAMGLNQQTPASRELWQQRVHPDDVERVKQAIEQAQHEGSLYHAECRLLRADNGALYWSDSYGRFLYDEQGEPARYVGVSFDSTQRKRVEETLRQSETRQAFLLEFGDRTRRLDDATAIMALAAEMLCRQLNAGRVGYGEVEPEARFIDVRVEYDLHQGLRPTVRVPIESYGQRAAAHWQSGQPWVIENVETDPRLFVRETASSQRAWGVRASIAIPLIKQERWVAVLYVTSPEARAWHPAEIELVREIAERTWEAVERARAEAILRISEERLRQATVSGLYLWDLDFRNMHFTVSENFAQVMGFSVANLDPITTDVVRQNVHPDDVEGVTQVFQQAIQNRQPLKHEYRIINPETGAIVWLSVNATMYFNQDGAPLRLLGSAQNVTTRRLAEEKLRASEERYRAIVTQAAVGVAQSDLKGYLIFANERFCEMIGYSRAELLGGKHLKDITCAEDFPRTRELGRRLITTGEPIQFEKRYVHKDGSLVWASVSTSLIRDAQGNPLNTQAVIVDITERKRHETAQRQLLGRLVTSQEEERRRLARELHDQMGQPLTALRLNLELLKKQTHTQPDALALVNRLEQIAARLDADTDFLAWHLRPAMLDNLGLAEALAAYVKEWSAHSGLHAEYHHAALQREPFAPELETNLYRITQEALNNVAKHADATHVDVLLEQRGHHLTLIVEDDGKGFEPMEEVERTGKGMGLITMRERAALFGGTVEIEAKPDDGTTVYVRIPLTENGDGA